MNYSILVESVFPDRIYWQTKGRFGSHVKRGLTDLFKAPVPKRLRNLLCANDWMVNYKVIRGAKSLGTIAYGVSKPELRIHFALGVRILVETGTNDYTEYSIEGTDMKLNFEGKISAKEKIKCQVLGNIN